MSTIQRFFTRTVMIRRAELIGGRIKSFATTTVSLPCHIQKAVGAAPIDTYGVSGAPYTGWFDVGADVQKDDLVTDDEGRIYEIVDVTRQGKDTAMNEHTEVLLRNYPG